MVKTYKQNQIQALQYIGNVEEVIKFCPNSKAEYKDTVIMRVQTDKGIKIVEHGDWIIKTGSGKYLVCNGKNIKMNELVSYVK